MLAQNERVHIHTASMSQLFETLALDLMGDECAALFYGQLIEGGGKLVDQDVAGKSRFRPTIRGRKQILKQESLAVLIDPGGPG